MIRIKKMPILVARYSWDAQIAPRCWIGGTAFTKRGARRQAEAEQAKRGWPKDSDASGRTGRATS